MTLAGPDPIMRTSLVSTRLVFSTKSILKYFGNPPIASDHQPRPFSPAVRAGDFVYLSGQVPGDEKGEIVQGGIEVQTRQGF